MLAMDTTFQQILQLSNERFQLYLAAGHQPLMPDQHARLDTINAKLPVLWDQYRRELAASHRPVGIQKIERQAA